ncbi:MAG: hypothetical protein Q8Q14_02795 [Gemmatimonadales bacterium]|nr:hypothetical protein [Gemmatimonadales bacterium]
MRRPTLIGKAGTWIFCAPTLAHVCPVVGSRWTELICAGRPWSSGIAEHSHRFVPVLT